MMGIGARKARKDLSADALFERLHAGFDQIPDSRSKDASISMGDALMSAFAMFSLKDPSLLAFDPGTPGPPRPQRQLPHRLRHRARPLRLADARHFGPRRPGPPAAHVSRCLPPPATRQSPGRLCLSGRPLPDFARWDRLFLLVHRQVRFVSGQAPSQWRRHLFSPNAGRRSGPSRPQGSHPAGARTDHQGGRRCEESRRRTNATPPAAG